MKKLLSLLLALMMVLSLGCAFAEGTPVEITFWHAMGGVNGEAIVKLVEDFNAAYEGKIHVNYEYQGDYDSAFTKIQAAGMNSIPCDLMQVYDIGTRFMIDSGWIKPVQEFIDAEDYDISQIEPNIAAYYTVDGKLYSMPFNSSTPTLYYNKTAFAEAGLDPEVAPKNFDELFEMARKLEVKNEDGTVKRYGFGMGNYGWFFEQWVGKMGREYVNNGNGRTSYATKVMFGENGAALDIFNMWKKISESKATYYVERGGTSAARAAFVAGDAAIFLASTANLAGVLANVGTNFEVGTAYFPYVNADDKGGVSTGGGTLWMIKSGNEAKEAAAFEFIKFCVNPENQAKWNAMTGYFPINVHAQETDTFKANIEKYPQFQTALDQLHDSAPEYVGSLLSVFPEVRQYVEDVTEKVCQGTLTPEAAVEELVKLANDAIETYNLVNY